MTVPAILATPTPSTVLAPTRREIRGLRRHRDGVASAVVPLPEGAVELGPVGVQAVDVAAVTDAVARLRERLGADRRSTVMVPTTWLRSHVIEAAELPRRRAELDEVVRWRLKKLLPVPPSAVRVDAVPLPERGGRRRLLCLIGMEKPLAALERAVAAAGCPTVVTTSRLFALLEGSGGPERRALVVVEESSASVALIEGAAPVVVRSRGLAEGEEPWPALEREVRLARSYLAEQLGWEDPVPARVLADDHAVVERIVEWWGAAGDAPPGPTSAADVRRRDADAPPATVAVPAAILLGVEGSAVR